MKLFGLFALVLSVLAMLMASSQASPAPAPAPAPGWKGVAKGVKTAIGVVGAIGTGKEIYDKVRGRG